MSEYADTLAWLYGLEAARGMDFKLERVALALAALGDPQRRYPCLHIAGTNGKGSVAAMLHAMLRAAGHRTGLYTSPHLTRFTERIRIGDAEISEAEVVSFTQEIRTAATLRGIELTFFEFITVMAFLAFARHAVDSAVVEVGLGGRLDATNVIDPVATIITTIGLDHEQYLGDTIESIAAEKGGIIKPGCPVVLGRLSDAARSVLKGIAAERNAPVIEASEEIQIHGTALLRVSGMGWKIDNLTLALRGRFQHDNAATALAAAALVRDRFGLSDGAVRRGLAMVCWPGRLEVVSSAPLIVLDGAHNEAGVQTLAEELPDVIGKRPLHLLFGVMSDKRWQPMVEQLGPMVRSATVTAILPPRGEAPERVAASFRKFCPTTVIPNARQAVRTLLDQIAPSEALLVTGSLFLVGAVSDLWPSATAAATCPAQP